MQYTLLRNPVLVEVTRNGFVESEHCGAVAVCEASGRLVHSIGETERPFFARSTVKALQALPLIESGAADYYGLKDEELALVCSSHNGEEIHADTARDILISAGLDESSLSCGTSRSLSALVYEEALVNGTKPSPLHHNCSGKHCGFLCVTQFEKRPLETYLEHEHPTMCDVRGVLENFTGTCLKDTDNTMCGIDGCSAPTYGFSLQQLATAFARFGSGQGLEPQRQSAAFRLRKACCEHSYMVAGKKRFCTDVMTLLGGRIFVKTGAEGGFIGYIDELGLGIAIKCLDGSQRGAEALMAGVISALLPLSELELSILREWTSKPLKNAAGKRVGEVRVREDFVNTIRQRR